MNKQFKDMDANTEQLPLEDVPVGAIPIEDFNRLYVEASLLKEVK